MNKLMLCMLCAVCFACGTPSPAEECRKITNEACHKLFTCDASAAMSTLGYTSEDDCKTKQATAFNCDGAKANCDYDDDAINQCISDTDKAACTATSSPASCSSSKICKAGSGGVSCGGTSEDVSSTNGNTVCTLTANGCTDSHTYGAKCTGTACTCQTDGVGGATFTASGDLCSSKTAGRAEMKTKCAFPY